MKPFRKNVAIAIDGGGIRGVMVAEALSVLESYLNKPSSEIFGLATGTSTGSIIASGIGAGFSAREMVDRYVEMGDCIFSNSFRKILFPLSRYRYSDENLVYALDHNFGNLIMSDFWNKDSPIDVVLTAYDLKENRTRFIKSWKKKYASWPVKFAVQASCTVPTYFPIVANRYIDGGVGSYGNPCYVAAYEAKECLKWDLKETTLISIGTGRFPEKFDEEKIEKLPPWAWIAKSVDIFMQSAYDQQVQLVRNHYPDIDFRRFQVDLCENIPMDNVKKMDLLIEYGLEMGVEIIWDMYDNPIEEPEKVQQNK